MSSGRGRRTVMIVEAQEITDLELARAIRGRAHWRRTGKACAVYCPAGGDREVRLRRLAQPTQRHRYVAVLVVNGRPDRSLPGLSGGEAIIWAERLVRPSPAPRSPAKA